jgi:uncharacterized membrane protein
MIYLVWLLRIIHIVGGVFWVGGTLIMTFFVAPAVGSIGEPGQKFITHLTNNLKLSTWMAAASGSTILAGFLLYIRGGTALMGTPFGIGLGIGAAFALVAFVAGTIMGRTIKAMARLGAQIQDKPSPEQLAQMQALQNRQRSVSMVSTICVILSTVFMAIARYL